MQPSEPQSTVRTLDALRSAEVSDWINVVLSESTVGDWLNQEVGQSSLSIGQLLTSIGLLRQSGGKYAFGSLDMLAGKAGLQIAEFLVGQILQKLEADKPLLALGKGGIWAFGVSEGADINYGLRLQIPDTDGAGNHIPGILVQLQFGGLLSVDTENDTWIKRSDPSTTFTKPGMSLALINKDSANTFTFKPKVDLVSIGVDIRGDDGKPLIDINGVRVSALEPRILLSLNLAEPSRVTWGAGIRCEQLGIPLGNGLSAVNRNPIAQSLLSSGLAGSSRSNETINPTFSASISKVFVSGRDTSTDVRLERADGSAIDIAWLPVQRAFGPLQCRRIGVQSTKGASNVLLAFLFDGSVTLRALDIDLKALSVGMPLQTPGQLDTYSFDLQGLDISYRSGPIAVSGGLIENTSVTPIEYDGIALIQAEKWSIAAIGSYALLNGQPSLFIFARLAATLGGPPFFFVTGFCAGFGYNRTLRIPEQNEVASFPLLAGINDPSKIGGVNPAPSQVLSKLQDWVNPAQGINWIAAGVQFTSFRLIQSNVVLVVIPTESFQVVVIGISRIKLAQEGPQFAYADLRLRVVLRLSDGFFGATAELAPNSYILDKACRLTGGFAFYAWFSKPKRGADHRGDFVVTLGGYHPAFNKPSWYPNEPRLGFSWHINNNLTIQGQAYFALTPSCIMSGGVLNVEFHSGNLRAWFTAQADFLFQWKPFYFIGSVGVRIGASYKLELRSSRLNTTFVSKTVTAELGAELEIYGPPTGGKVYIDWKIISFTISFGAQPGRPSGYLNWNDFSNLLPENDRFLLPEKKSTNGQRLPFNVEVYEPIPLPERTSTASLTNVCKLTISNGLMRLANDRMTWIVRTETLEFNVETVFPLTELNLAGSTGTTKYKAENPTISVRPMGIGSVTSKMTITIRKEGRTQDLGQRWNWAATNGNVPAALWGKPLPVGSSPKAPSSEMLPERLVGISAISPKQVLQPESPLPIPLENLAYTPCNRGNSNYLPLSSDAVKLNRQPVQTPTSLRVIADTIGKSTVQVRNDVFAALASFGYNAGTNGSTEDIAANVSFNYQAAPMLGAPWEEAQ